MAGAFDVFVSLLIDGEREDGPVEEEEGVSSLASAAPLLLEPLTGVEEGTGDDVAPVTRACKPVKRSSLAGSTR